MNIQRRLDNQSFETYTVQVPAGRSIYKGFLDAALNKGFRESTYFNDKNEALDFAIEKFPTLHRGKTVNLSVELANTRHCIFFNRTITLPMLTSEYSPSELYQLSSGSTNYQLSVNRAKAIEFVKKGYCKDFYIDFSDTRPENTEESKVLYYVLPIWATNQSMYLDIRPITFKPCPLLTNTHIWDEELDVKIDCTDEFDEPHVLSCTIIHKCLGFGRYSLKFKYPEGRGMHDYFELYESEGGSIKVRARRPGRKSA